MQRWNFPMFGIVKQTKLPSLYRNRYSKSLKKAKLPRFFNTLNNVGNLDGLNVKGAVTERGISFIKINVTVFESFVMHALTLE